MHHDYIQLFLTKEKDGKFTISDDGHTVSELMILGMDVNTSIKKKQFFKTTLKIFGVSFDGNADELFVTFDELEDYPKNSITCSSALPEYQICY